MAICVDCKNGNHHHDTYPNGITAECPRIADPANKFSGQCTCPVRLPSKLKNGTCPTCGCGVNHG